MKQLNKKEIRKFIKATPKRDQEVYLVLENVEYARNVAGIFRTAEAAGVRRLYLTGISHQPPFGKDLAKASRSSEERKEWLYEPDAVKLLPKLKQQGFTIIAVEITDEGYPVLELPKLIKGKQKLCFVAGSEVFGLKKATLALCDFAVHVPMYGRNASLNVGASVAVVLYAWD